MLRGDKRLWGSGGGNAPCTGVPRIGDQGESPFEGE